MHVFRRIAIATEALAVTLLAPVSAVAGPDCSTAEGAQAAQEQIEAALAEIQADQRAREAEVDKEIDAKAAAAAWSDAKRSEVLLRIATSPGFAAFEEEKQPFTQELMKLMTSTPPLTAPGGRQAQCESMNRLTALLPKLKEVNARQYAHMAAQVRAAK